MRFELDHLASYDDAALLAELRRVAALVPAKTLTVTQFNSHAKVHASTLQKRFGSWKSALEAAGLSDRFDEGSIAWSKEVVWLISLGQVGRLTTLVRDACVSALRTFFSAPQRERWRR